MMYDVRCMYVRCTLDVCMYVGGLWTSDLRVWTGGWTDWGSEWTVG